MRGLIVGDIYGGVLNGDGGSGERCLYCSETHMAVKRLESPFWQASACALAAHWYGFGGEVDSTTRMLTDSQIIQTPVFPLNEKIASISNNYFTFHRSLILRCGGTGDNLYQLSSDDGLAGTIVENLELVDHVSCVLGGVLGDKKSAMCISGVGKHGIAR